MQMLDQLPINFLRTLFLSLDETFHPSALRAIGTRRMLVTYFLLPERWAVLAIVLPQHCN